MRRVWKWTEKQQTKLGWIQDVLTELSEYLPLTLRQIYYQLVGKGLIENKISEYNMLSGLLKHARLDNFVSWEAIEDRSRNFVDLTGWIDYQIYLTNYVEYMIDNYQMNLMQTQENYIEIWIEKDALSSLFIKFATPYTIPVVVCRGFSSISFLHSFVSRLHFVRKKSIMLYFGDFDPSGMEMLEAMKTTLRDEFCATGVEFKRVALQRDDIFKYNLPHNPSALKKTDTRAEKHLEKYGQLAVELDALRPDVLEKKTKNAIASCIDIKKYMKEVKVFEQDKRDLKNLKSKFLDLI